jgi:PAS domain S-box-containing protein
MNTASLSALLDYANNAALLTVGLLIYALVKQNFARYPAWLRQILEGVCFSLLVALTMVNPLRLHGGVILDLRTTLICLAVIFGGPLSGLVAGAFGVGLRLALGGEAALAGIMLVIFPYALSLGYRAWIERRDRPIGYGDLALLGIALDAVRMGVWLIFLGYDFTLQAMNAAWFGILFLVPCSVIVLGSAVLLIEERRSLAQSVADSEARFRSVLDQLPEGLTLVDRSDRFTYVNKAWEAVTGFTAAFVLGKTRREIWQARGSAPGPFERPDLVEQVRDAAQPLRTEPRLIEFQGKARWVVGTLFPVRNSKGEIREIGTTGNEVTDLVLTREDLARREEIAQRHKNALLDAVRASQIHRPLLESIQALTEIAGDTLEVERTSLFRADFDSHMRERLDLWERSTRRHLPSTPEMMSPIWQFAASLPRESVVAIEDVTAEPRLAERAAHYRRHDIRSLMLAPIFTDGRCIGTVVYTAVKETRKWTAEDIHFARSMADILALLILADRYRESLAALDLIEDAIYLEGADGRVIYANRVALRMSGRGEGGEQQQPLAASLPMTFPRPPRSLEADHDQHEIVLDLGSGHRDLQIERHRLPHGGIIVLVRDVTHRRAAERERESLEQQLMQAHKLEALGEMAGGIAHDFNNLLGAIGGFARFLEEDLPRGATQNQYARRILSACDRGKAVVTQILSFAKLRNIERHPIDLRVLFDGSLDLLRGLVSPMTAISFDIGDAPLPILGNDGQMTQLLVNLCANANDALDGEPGTVMVRARRIPRGEAAMAKEERQLSRFDGKYRRRRMFGRLDRGCDYVRIDVSDSGKGIAPQLLPRIFEPFYTTKHRQGGTGLGLAVVQSVVSLYDGVLFVDTCEGKGTAFSLYLPLTDMVVQPAIGGAGVEAQTSGSERVLIVDDDVDVADMLSIGLERLGYAVAAVNDPVQALATFRAGPDNWDIAIVDRIMPEMDGITLAGRLRAVRSGLPVILCTGLDDGTIEHGDGRGAFDAFFTKPVAPAQIAGAIRRLVDR